MKYRKGIAAVVFRRNKGEKEFLLFHRIKNWRGWEFPKGGRKRGESETACLKREMFEELGTKRFKVVRKTNRRLKYKWPKNYPKDGDIFNGVDNLLYIVKFSGDKIKYDQGEHDGFLWLNAKKALKKLTYKDQRDALKYVIKLLATSEKGGTKK